MTTMTPDRADVKVLQSMVDTMVGIPKFSYPARQNGQGLDQPKPKGEFAHIRLIEEYQEGVPNQQVESQTDETTTFVTRSLVRIRARIGVVETSGIPSTKIMNGWTSEAMKALMISTGYGFVRCTPLSSEDSKLEKEWEYRKGFSVDFYVTRVFRETVSNIGAVFISGEFITDNLDSHFLNIEVNE